MGFNFQAGHPNDILCDSSDIVELLQARFGAALPLGTPGERFCLNDELAWSWWSELQTFAKSKLDESQTVQLCAVDAWHGVYIDADVVRELLWPPGTSPSDDGPQIESVTVISGGFFSRILQSLGLKRKSPDSDQQALVNSLLRSMVNDYGPRAGEKGAFQVGNLRRLIRELDLLLALLEIEASAKSVEAVSQAYWSSERADDDGHIQCLCHAWLTAKHAVKIRAPLWLVK